AGETTKPEETAAVLQVEGKGYTLKVSVTNEQARKVQVGDTAELQNAWYYDDAQVILTGIKPDPDNPGQNKLLEFNVTGSSIQAGQALSISVGQRSSEYEFVVPNSAVREDNNGKFILIVESKSGPLSNRYIATRVDVEVLASDDNYTAISAGLYGYEYVITTSTKPVEAGKQVRLNESQ
ncbi:MAG: RND transporter, partial [Lachnospiraceae bacterium]|nr:RND transporter [Lachnospiraceae bacterium]